MSEAAHFLPSSGSEDFEALFENAPCGYIVIAADGRIDRVNQTFCEWTGYSKAQLLGKRLNQLLSMAGRIFYETHVSPLLRMQGHFDEFAIDFVNDRAERLPALAYAVEQRDSNENLLLTKLIVTKATDRRRYERELVDARKTATEDLRSERETSELREQFIAVLGHDLRNPLAALAGGLRILQRSETLRGEKDRRIAEMMHATIARMSGLIDNVMDFARGRLGGGITLNRDPVADLAPALEQVIDELRTVTLGRTVEASISIREPVDCDLMRIGQLVSNLVGNALTHGSPEKAVRIGATTNNGIFKLWVANEGEPIPERAMAKLFEPFFRGEVRDSRQGLGLGLHIASEIARAHDGALSVTSAGEETRFTFTMPCRRQAG